MAPKVIRKSTAAKAKAKAEAKAKAKAKAKAVAATPSATPSMPIWNTFDVQAVYVSKVTKAPATFLNLTLRQVEKYDMDLRTAQRFTPVQETGIERYPTAIMTVRLPSNAAARRLLEGTDASGIIMSCRVDNDHKVAHNSVIALCRYSGYPLF